MHLPTVSDDIEEYLWYWMIKCSKSAAMSLPIPTQNLHGWLRLGELFLTSGIQPEGDLVTS